MSHFTDSRIMSGRAHLDGGEIDERDIGNEALNQVINPLILNDVIAAQELMIRARDDCMSRINEMNFPVASRRHPTGHSGSQPHQQPYRQSNSPLPIQASFDEHLSQMIEQIQREIKACVSRCHIAQSAFIRSCNQVGEGAPVKKRTAKQTASASPALTHALKQAQMSIDAHRKGQEDLMLYQAMLDQLIEFTKPTRVSPSVYQSSSDRVQLMVVPFGFDLCRDNAIEIARSFHPIAGSSSCKVKITISNIASSHPISITSMCLLMTRSSSIDQPFLPITQPSPTTMRTANLDNSTEMRHFAVDNCTLQPRPGHRTLDSIEQSSASFDFDIGSQFTADSGNLLIACQYVIKHTFLPARL